MKTFPRLPDIRTAPGDLHGGQAICSFSAAVTYGLLPKALVARFEGI
jgi:hypothetical protein